jgi:muramoyltetrapeptide carboxypeptidase
MTGRPRIGLIAPSGAIDNDDLVERALVALAGRGWEVVAGAGVYRRDGRFAGTDDQRLDELISFCCDPSLDVVLAARGGYGLSRLLERIDFDALRRAAPLVAGLSDFTAFNLAYLACAGGVSFQGPTIADFVRDDGFSAGEFFETIGCAQREIVFAGAVSWNDPTLLDVSGPLWGGNLAMASSLAGSRFLPSVQGGILFLEDINEAPYRVERMLYQLHHAGVLHRQRALLLGDFTSPPGGAAAGEGPGTLDLAGIVAQIGAASGVPIVTGLPFGHGPRRVTLPVGGFGRLQAGGGEVRLTISQYPHLGDSRRGERHSFG